MLSTKILYPEKIIKQTFLDLKKKKLRKYTASKSALTKKKKKKKKTHKKTHTKKNKITKKEITVMHMKFCLTQKKALMEKL